MSLFAITFRLAESDGPRLRALDHAVRRLSPSALLYDETAGFYLVKAETTSQAVHDTLTAAAGLRPERDLLLVINLSHPEFMQTGSEVPQRLKALMASR
jgi:hypothetical protein